jgi:uncharacterized BrkB/YihY/UPF0761 family membrane protein
MHARITQPPPRGGGIFNAAYRLASIYVVMPLGRGSLRAACIGGLFAALLWRAVQWGLVFYLANISAAGGSCSGG